jgi:hypothetical protein
MYYSYVEIEYVATSFSPARTEAVKLFLFWARHMWRTSRGVDNWTDRTYDDIRTQTNQKTLEDNLLDTKPPKTPVMTLDPQLAAKAFTDMLILLGKMRGIAGHPLSYVLHSNLKGPNNANIDDESEDPHLLANRGALTSQLTTSFVVGPPYCVLT